MGLGDGFQDLPYFLYVRCVIMERDIKFIKLILRLEKIKNWGLLFFALGGWFALCGVAAFTILSAIGLIAGYPLDLDFLGIGKVQI